MLHMLFSRWWCQLIPGKYLNLYSLNNIQWLKDFLNDFKNNGGSIICTSHDSGFLNEMCSHIIDFQDRKLITFRDINGDVLRKFVDKYPESISRCLQMNL